VDVSPGTSGGAALKQPPQDATFTAFQVKYLSAV
jgi:hypothetical protein